MEERGLDGAESGTQSDFDFEMALNLEKELVEVKKARYGFT